MPIEQSEHMPRGGARPNSGPDKGAVYGPHRATIAKEAARAALRQIVLREMDALVSAQIAAAKGLRYLVARDKAGKFSRLTEAQASERMGDDACSMEVWEKDPSTTAFTDLMNRALDKPVEQVAQVVSGTVVYRHELGSRPSTRSKRLAAATVIDAEADVSLAFSPV